MPALARSRVLDATPQAWAQVLSIWRGDCVWGFCMKTQVQDSNSLDDASGAGCSLAVSPDTPKPSLNELRGQMPASFAVIPTCQRHEADADWFPAVDLFEEESQYVVYVDLPGLNSSTIKIEVDDEVLAVSGCRKVLSAGAKCLHAERPLGRFIRRIPLFENVCREEIQGSFQDGTLTLLLPKKSDLVPESNGHGPARIQARA